MGRRFLSSNVGRGSARTLSLYVSPSLVTAFTGLNVRLIQVICPTKQFVYCDFTAQRLPRSLCAHHYRIDRSIFNWVALQLLMNINLTSF